MNTFINLVKKSLVGEEQEVEWELLEEYEPYYFLCGIFLLGFDRLQAHLVFPKCWLEYWHKGSNKYGILKLLQKTDCNAIFPNELVDLLGIKLLEL